ncbi:hypothetical protein HOI71_23120, partial [Candidatus Poribacteria bacterium]|nr:hypothetical protein [Candidatus Poribacteria bacterium]
MGTRWAWIVAATVLAGSSRIGVTQDIVWEPTYGPAIHGTRLCFAPDGTLYALNSGLHRYLPRERQWQYLGFGSSVTDVGLLGGAVYAIRNGVVHRKASPEARWAVVQEGLPAGVRASGLATVGEVIFTGGREGVFSLRDDTREWTVTGRVGWTTRIVAAESVLFAHTGNSGTIRSGNAGASWIRVWDRRIEDIVAVDSVFYGWEYGTNGPLLESLDRGVSWDSIGYAPLPWISGFVIVDGDFYVHSWQHGVYHSADRGISWKPVNSGLLSLGVGAMAASDTDIYADTANSGVFRASLVPRTPADTASAERRVDYQIPAGMSLYSTPLHATRIATDARSIDMTRAGGALMAHHLIQLGSSVVISLDSGRFRTAIGRDGVMVFGEDFAIEPSRGYVVNALAPIDVTMDGFPHGAVIEAPEATLANATGAWGFVVAGHVEGAATLPMGARLRVANMRTGQAALADLGAGREFAVTFTDLTRGAVVAEGDVFRLELLSRDGLAFGRERLTRVGAAELRQAHVLLSLSARPDAARLLPNYPNPFNP